MDFSLPDELEAIRAKTHDFIAGGDDDNAHRQRNADTAEHHDLRDGDICIEALLTGRHPACTKPTRVVRVGAPAGCSSGRAAMLAAMTDLGWSTLRTPSFAAGGGRRVVTQLRARTPSVVVLV